MSPLRFTLIRLIKINDYFLINSCRGFATVCNSLVKKLNPVSRTLSRLYSTGTSNLSLRDEGVQAYIKYLSNNSELTESRTSGNKGVLVKVVREILAKQDELEELNLLGEDKDFKDIAANDAAKVQAELQVLGEQFFESVLDPEPLDHNDVALEVQAGVGGQEAMLFAHEIYRMYQNFAEYHGLECVITKFDNTEIGGLRQGIATISGMGAYRLFKYEGGVHRVQRVPKTEKSGRVHTSTATVAVLPLPTDIQVVINPQDLKFEAKKASGAGGQHVNTTESAVRLTHIPTGITIDCQMERSQIRNRELALKMLRARIYEKELQAQTSNIRQTRKLQTGFGGRSEKIRTYNYVQDRVTDHRVGLSVFNLRGVLDGGEYLNDLVQKLFEFDSQERLTQLFEDSAAKCPPKSAKAS